MRYIDVSRHAASLGLSLDTVGLGAEQDRWWLVSGGNWQATGPGRTLAEISADLNERDRGAFLENFDYEAVTGAGLAPGQRWTPCPPDAACRNCGHPMEQHWARNPKCSQCGECPRWSCPEGAGH